MRLLAHTAAARLLREAQARTSLSGSELAAQARLRDPSWPLPTTATISTAVRSLAKAGHLQATNIRQSGNDPYYYRLTPAGAAERARLFPEAAVAV